MFKSNVIIKVVLLFIISLELLTAQEYLSRKEFNLPDISGYKTLKCDLHMHTVFSDGNVWPSVRAVEAWREGLDAIAITDHLEYLPHKHDMNIEFNRSSEIAKESGDRLDIITIKGSEITRSMPPGHFNAIFLTDASKLKTDAWRDAFDEASKQSAFIFWNHPGWKGQQKDGVPRWYDEHTELYEKGQMHGIEVVNDREYYPLAHKWAIEKKLTMLSNSDIHDPSFMYFDFDKKDYRAITLVFAVERNEMAIKEALLERRTAVYFNNHLIGDEKFLRPLFENSIRLNKKFVEINGKGSQIIQIKNNSDIDYKLTLAKEFDELRIPESVTLVANKTTMFELRSKVDDLTAEKEFSIPFKAENLLVKPNEGMNINFDLTVKFIATKK